MNCFNAKLIIAPLVQTATKNKIKNVVLESLQTLFGPCHDHELSKHTAHLIHLVLKKNIIDLLEEIKKDLNIQKQQNNKAGMAILKKVTEINKTLLK